MNEQLRKLYLTTTRNSDFILQRNINKYLPLRNDLVNYDSILELNKNLAEVQIAFKVQQKKKKHESQSSNSNQKDKHVGKRQKRAKSKSDFFNPALLQVYKSNQVKRKAKNIISVDKLKNNHSITIIENQPDPQTSTNQNPAHKKPYKFYKSQVNDPKNKQKQEFQVHESELDDHIDQYLQQLMQQENVNIRKQIESDRKLFIEKVIKNLKKKIQLQKSNQKQQEQEQNLWKNNQKPDKKQNDQDNSQKNDQTTFEREFQKKPETQKIKLKEKIKCKSTQLMSSPPAQMHQKTPKRHQTILPCLKPRPAQTMTQQIPHRSIYNSSPNSSFITKIGKTFYLNELNNLNKTIQLEARNRQRAQRFFRRKLMNIERQHEKFVNGGREEA